MRGSCVHVLQSPRQGLGILIRIDTGDFAQCPMRGMGKLANPMIAILPLLVAGIVNKWLTLWIPQDYGDSASFIPAVIGNPTPVVQEISKVTAIRAVEGALLLGIPCVLLFAWKPVKASFTDSRSP